MMLRVRVCDWNQGEWRAAFSQLFSSRSASRILKQKLEQYYQQPVVLLNSARAGIQLMLQQWTEQKPDRKIVLYPCYICDSVPKIIENLGLQGRPVPVNAELNLCHVQLSEYLTSDVLAVIAPHMYGVPAPIQQIEQLCVNNGVYLIDDAAQICGVAVDTRPLGTFGDAGVLSFAQSKTLVSGVRGSGGMLLSKAYLPNTAFKKRIGWGRVGALWHFYASYQHHGWLTKLDYWQSRLWQRLGITNKNPYDSKLGISELDAAIILRQWKSLPHRQLLLANQANALIEEVKCLTTLTFPQLKPGLVITRLMLQSKTVPPALIQSELNKLGIASKKAYSGCSKAYDGNPASGLLELPWQALSKEEFFQLVSALKVLDQWCIKSALR